MQMLVEEMLDRKGRKIFAMRPEQSVREAVALIAQRNIGAMLVTAPDGALLGIISERDVVRCLHEVGGGVLDLPIGDFMTRSVITCAPETTIADALSLMGVHRIRHLPVVCGKEVLGLISVRDVLEAQLETQEGHFAALVHAKRQASLALQAAELAHRAKTEFLANISYELKNPLGTIVGFAEYLSNEAFDLPTVPEQAQYLRKIEDDSRHLLEIVDNLLDLSRIQIKALEPAEETLSLPQLVESCIADVTKDAARKGVMLEVATDVPASAINADKKLMRRMLVNLLTNAIKLTHQGGTVSVRSAIGSDGDVRVTVSDTGVGIAPDHLAKIMPSAHQPASHYGHDSTSLRLALVNAAVQAHGGLLDIESRVGIGTTATLRFPAERTLRAQAA
jgi:signal transduction histidine kinase